MSSLIKWRRSFLVFFVVILSAGCWSGSAGHRPASASPELPGVRDLGDQPVNPLVNGKTSVFIFVRTDCPISNHYAPEIQRLKEKYEPQKFAFWLVYPDADTTASEITGHLRDYQLSLPALRDPQHTLVKRTGAVVTPEAAVFLANRRQVYRGRIDDRYVDFGKERTVPTRRDLDNVLAAIASGKPIAPSTTRAAGCYIPELGK